jgi:hypothetical protein
LSLSTEDQQDKVRTALFQAVEFLVAEIAEQRQPRRQFLVVFSKGKSFS